MTTSFTDLGVPADLAAVLARKGIEAPFPIQEYTIPDALQGLDVTGRAPTGSGKTIAFGLAVAAQVKPAKPKRPTALILAPTRELAEQIMREVEPLAATRGFKCAAVYGGTGYGAQQSALRRGVEILVACPGRLEDLIQRRDVDLSDVHIVVLDEAAPVSDALGALGASEPDPNPTLLAVANQYAAPGGWQAVASVPFSSARKWSSATFAAHGSWVLGAPEVLLGEGDPVRDQADGLASGGARVLLLASAEREPNLESGVGPVHPAALVVIDQTLRPDAAETVRYFLDQGVRMIVISGDNAVTVGAIAELAGIPGADAPRDARDLPEDKAALADVLDGTSVFGRVTPAQKRAMVGALQSRGHVVAMTGDGVNDVLALKDADLGIAMGSGAGATRSVAQIVLLDDKFSVMPSVVAEGRRVLGNVERVSDLFLTKSFYAMAVSIATVLFVLPFPFLNRHLTVTTFFTIGAPAFFLALMPNTQRFRPGFFGRVLRFAVPAGLICALSSYVSYGYVLKLTSENINEARSAAVVTLFVVAWWVLVQVARPLNLIRGVIVGVMLAGFVILLHVPWSSRLFDLTWSPDREGLVALGVGIIGCALVSIAFSLSGHGQRVDPAGEDAVHDGG